jgi:hypothetical protein
MGVPRIFPSGTNPRGQFRPAVTLKAAAAKAGLDISTRSFPGSDDLLPLWTFNILVIRTHRVATAIDPNTLLLTTVPGDTTTDPAATDNNCLKSPNNVPARLVRQSPIMTPTKPITMPNGFTYHLQELAFFSWFFGAPSVAVNGWFSNYNTFSDQGGTPLDAGPRCP